MILVCIVEGITINIAVPELLQAVIVVNLATLLTNMSVDESTCKLLHIASISVSAKHFQAYLVLSKADVPKPTTILTFLRLCHKFFAQYYAAALVNSKLQ